MMALAMLVAKAAERSPGPAFGSGGGVEVLSVKRRRRSESCLLHLSSRIRMMSRRPREGLPRFTLGSSSATYRA